MKLEINFGGMKMLEKIKEKFEYFIKEAEKPAKAAHARARKASSEITKMFKEYRKQSIEADKK